jgi:hypothetical protein
MMSGLNVNPPLPTSTECIAPPVFDAVAEPVAEAELEAGVGESLCALTCSNTDAIIVNSVAICDLAIVEVVQFSLYSKKTTSITRASYMRGTKSAGGPEQIDQVRQTPKGKDENQVSMCRPSKNYP